MNRTPSLMPYASICEKASSCKRYKPILCASYIFAKKKYTIQYSTPTISSVSVPKNP